MSFRMFSYFCQLKRVLLQSGIEVDLNLDGRTFYTALNQLFILSIKKGTQKSTIFT